MKYSFIILEIKIRQSVASNALPSFSLGEMFQVFGCLRTIKAPESNIHVQISLPYNLIATYAQSTLFR